MNKCLWLIGIIASFCILVFFVCSPKNAYSSEMEGSITLPFNYLDYCDWLEKYDMGERDDHPYGRDFSFDSLYGGDPKLVRRYLDIYNDTTIIYYSKLNTKNKSFEAYILFGKINKIITVSNNQIIGRISIGSEGKDYEWKELTFVITKEFDVIVYKNTLRENKVIKQDVVERYKIYDNGKIVKMDGKK